MLQDERSLVGMTEEQVRQIVREELAKAKDPGSKKAAIIASKGTLDWAYPPLILANAAAAAGMECSVFFTFYGLNILKKDFGRTVRVGPTGNPAMPMPVPMPQLLTVIPGMVPGATWMMKQKFKKKNVADIEELRSLAIESGVKLIGCTMTMDVFGYTDEDFIDGVEYGGAAAFLSEARKANVTLFI